MTEMARRVLLNVAVGGRGKLTLGVLYTVYGHHAELTAAAEHASTQV